MAGESENTQTVAGPADGGNPDADTRNKPAKWNRPLPQIPGYTDWSYLTSGGQGDIFRARQVQLDRWVAIKILRFGFHLDAKHIARFRRGAQGVAKLDHPHIIRVFDCGDHQGQIYLVMEYLDGGGLEERMRRPLRPLDAAVLVAQLAEGMHQAHLGGLVHRDLKPANVLFTSTGIPKITDFELVKRIDMNATSPTATGTVMGTAGYMSPEQAGGQIRQIGPASDIWALGVMLYEMLTGVLPFTGETWLDTLMAIRHAAPEPVTAHNPNLPKSLAAICQRRLIKQPTKRYATAADLAAALRAFAAMPATPGALAESGPQGKAPRQTQANESSETRLQPGPAPKVVKPAAISAVIEFPPAVQAKLNKYRWIEERPWVPLSTRAATSSIVPVMLHRNWVGERSSMKQRVTLHLYDPNLADYIVDMSRYTSDLRRELRREHLLLPNYAAGQADGWSYLVELATPNGTLDLLPDSPSVYKIAEGTFSLAKATQTLHRWDWVHGWIEPANIVVEPNGALLLASSGWWHQPRRAPAVQQPMSWETLLSVGNPEFLAPEVVRTGVATPASDVYGIGAVLYWLLTMQLPVIPEVSVDGVLPKLPSPRMLRHGVSRELSSLAMRCLHYDPVKRCELDDFLSELTEFLLELRAESAGEG